jgi:hypothetical protein
MPKKNEQEPMPLTVSFSPRLRTDGVLVNATLNQGPNEIMLTHEQVRSLVLTLSARCSLDAQEEK